MTSKSDNMDDKNQIFPFRNSDQMENYLPYLLNRLAREWSAIQAQVLQEHGWTEAMLRIMSSLHAHGRLTVNEVAALSLIEQSSASRMIESLVNDGHVLRKISTKDQRVRTVALTSRGKKKLQGIAPAINDIYSRFIGQLEPGELNACIAGLHKLDARIEPEAILKEDLVA